MTGRFLDDDDTLDPDEIDELLDDDATSSVKTSPSSRRDPPANRSPKRSQSHCGSHNLPVRQSNRAIHGAASSSRSG